MSTLVIVEHDNKVMQPTTRNMVAAALEFGNNPILLVAGHECLAVAEEAAAIAGVHAVWLVEDIHLKHQLAENLSQLVTSIASSFSAILAPATTFGKNVLPRVAAKLDMAQISDVTRIFDENTFEHPIYAGNALEKINI